MFVEAKQAYTILNFVRITKTCTGLLTRRNENWLSSIGAEVGSGLLRYAGEAVRVGLGLAESFTSISLFCRKSQSVKFQKL